MLIFTLALTDILLVVLIFTLTRKVHKEKVDNGEIFDKPLFKPKEIPETEEERKYRIIMSNLDSYRGNAEGQVKV